MASLSVRNLDAELVGRLKRRAARHGHSAEAEVRDILHQALSAETEPTLYWRDRLKDGPTYHIDYVFLPRDWAAGVREMTLGSFEDWCGARLSDHVPLVVDVVPKEKRFTTEDTESTEKAV